MKILVICHDKHHSGQIVIDGFNALKNKDYEFNFIQNGLDVDPSTFKNYKVIVIAQNDEATPENQVSWETDAIQEAFVQYVENGGGLLAVHAGLVAGQNTEKLHSLIGAKFISHPADSMVTVGVLKDHPVTKDVNTFIVPDEHYILEILSQDIDILMASYSPPRGIEDKYISDSYFNNPAIIAPACYVRHQGKGRVAVLTNGHHLKAWLDPNFQKLLTNSIYWCAN